MKPSQFNNSVNFAYKVYKMKCRAAGTQPLPLDKFHLDTIRRISNILLPAHAFFRMEMDDDGTTVTFTHNSHRPRRLSIKTDLSSTAFVAWYYEDQTNTQPVKLASLDCFDIVEFCIAALRKYNFIFQKSTHKPSITTKEANQYENQ